MRNDKRPSVTDRAGKSDSVSAKRSSRTTEGTEISRPARRPVSLLSGARTIRRPELHQLVPLSDSTIFDLEQRGEFPRRFFITERCVVWNLAEVEAWLEQRRRASNVAKVERGPSVRPYRPRRQDDPVGSD